VLISRYKIRPKQKAIEIHIKIGVELPLECTCSWHDIAPSCCNSRRILTETETSLITQKRYNELIEQQKRVDAEIDAQLSRQEDDLRLEEEVLSIDLYY